MSMIKGINTKPEIVVRKHLFANGFRYRLHCKALPGKPDIVLSKYRVVIFVNGCFWHGHEGCKGAVIPKTRTQWWLTKIGATKERDLYTHQQLSQDGWEIITVWSCELNSENRESTLRQIVQRLKRINRT